MRLVVAHVVIASTLLVGSAGAEPITLKGINWTMDYADMINQLNVDGYECIGETNPLFGKNTPQGNAIMAYLCKNNSAKIRITSDSIRMSCSVFNMCDYPAESAAQKLVDDGKVSELIPKVTEDQTMAILDPGNSSYVEWCGTGDDWDGVCVESNPRTDNLDAIILRKGATGKSLSFD